MALLCITGSSLFQALADREKEKEGLQYKLQGLAKDLKHPASAYPAQQVETAGQTEERKRLQAQVMQMEAEKNAAIAQLDRLANVATELERRATEVPPPADAAAALGLCLIPSPWSGERFFQAFLEGGCVWDSVRAKVGPKLAKGMELSFPSGLESVLDKRVFDPLLAPRRPIFGVFSGF